MGGARHEAPALPEVSALRPAFRPRLPQRPSSTVLLGHRLSGCQQAGRVLSAKVRGWGCPVSDGCIHQHLQSLGEAAELLELPHPVIPPQEPEFSVVIMLDGWMARERGPDWGAGPRKKEPQRVLWHEVKSAVIYRLERRAANDSGRGMLIEKFVVATPPETSPVDFGAAVQSEARRRG